MFPSDPELPALPAEVRRGGERDTLLAMLDHYRAVLVRKAWGLSPAQLDHRVASSELTLGGLVKHMAWVENLWFWRRFAGWSPRDPWAGAPFAEDHDWEFHSARRQPLAALVELFEREVADARRITDAAHFATPLCRRGRMAHTTCGGSSCT